MKMFPRPHRCPPGGLALASAPMHPSQRVGPPVSGVATTEIDGRISILNPVTDRVVMLHETASDVWRLADGQHSVEEMTRLLAASYQSEPDRIRADVESAIEMMQGEGLLPGDGP